MGRKSTISDHQKIEAVTSYLNGTEGISCLCHWSDTEHVTYVCS